MAKGFTHESQHNESKEWYTPPEIFKTLGVEFDLDPCSPSEKLPWIPVKHIISLPKDGLTEPWEGFVWMNPPYGQDTPDWLEKFIDHGNGIALVFARTDTEWFHKFALAADCLLFTSGRIKFLKPDGTTGNGPGTGSLFIGCGEKAMETLYNCEDELGWYVELNSGIV